MTVVVTLINTDIEDLTHKTGNFKQFTVFISMLESALSKVSCFVPGKTITTFVHFVMVEVQELFTMFILLLHCMVAALFSYTSILTEQ